MKKQHLHLIICFTFFVFCILQTACGLTPQEQRERFIEQCKSYLGTPYKYGGTNKKGMDCSGFIFTSAKESLGIDLPRRSEDLYNSLEHIEKGDLQPGDLIFFKATTRINHAAVYLGDNTFIHSASDGPQTGVIISSLDESYWKQTYAGCAHFLPKLSENELASLLKGEKKTLDEEVEPETPKTEEVQVAKTVEKQTAGQKEAETVEKVANAPVTIKKNENGGGGTKALRIEARTENAEETARTAQNTEKVTGTAQPEETFTAVVFEKYSENANDKEAAELSAAEQPAEPAAPKETVTTAEPETGKENLAAALPKPLPVQSPAANSADNASATTVSSSSVPVPEPIEPVTPNEQIAKVSTPVQNDEEFEEIPHALPVAEPVVIEKVVEQIEDPRLAQTAAATATSAEADKKAALPLPAATTSAAQQAAVKTSASGNSVQVPAADGAVNAANNSTNASRTEPRQTVVAQPQLNVTISVEGFIN